MDSEMDNPADTDVMEDLGFQYTYMVDFEEAIMFLAHGRFSAPGTGPYTPLSSSEYAGPIATYHHNQGREDLAYDLLLSNLKAGKVRVFAIHEAGAVDDYRRIPLYMIISQLGEFDSDEGWRFSFQQTEGFLNFSDLLICWRDLQAIAPQNNLLIEEYPAYDSDRVPPLDVERDLDEAHRMLREMPPLVLRKLEDLPGYRPETPEENPTSLPVIAGRPVQAAARIRNRGGRPAVHDWDAFIREMMRRANSPDGLPDRPALFREMMQWFEDNYGRMPSESTLRDKIAAWYPS